MVHVKGEVAAYQEAVTSSQGDEVILLVGSDPGFHGTVVKAGHQLYAELHLSLYPFYHAKDLLVRMVLSSFPHGEAIANSHLLASSSKRRL